MKGVGFENLGKCVPGASEEAEANVEVGTAGISAQYHCPGVTITNYSRGEKKFFPFTTIYFFTNYFCK